MVWRPPAAERTIGAFSIYYPASDAVGNSCSPFPKARSCATLLPTQDAILPVPRELPPMPFDISIYAADQSFLWDRQWEAVTGVPDVSFLLDARNVVLGSGAAVALKPALQFAVTRTDRPDDGVLITAGSAVTGNALTPYLETISAGGKAFFRRGLGFRLTAGSFARAQGILYAAHRSNGLILPAEEIVFNPTNDTAAPSYLPIGGGRPIATNGVDKAKLVVFGMGNLTTTMGWRLAARAFNDPLARGAWTDLDSSWNTPQTADFEANTTELAFTGITLANFQWLELALAVRKNAGGDVNSRCIFHVIPALKYL